MADEMSQKEVDSFVVGARVPEGVDALTQKDIDQLLQGAGAARARKPAVEVVPYNFLRPPRISKERRVALESIYARFAVSLQSLLSTRLRTPTDVSCTVEQATFAEYVLSIANPCAAFVFDVGGGGGGQGTVDLSTDVAFYLLDRVFGGPGETTNVGRPLTMLERTVARGITEKMLLLLKEAWQDHLPMSPEIIGFESTPDMLQFANHEDNVLVANIEVRSGGFNGLIAMCVPLISLEGFLGEKTGPGGVSGSRAAPVEPIHRQVVQRALLNANVDLTARFATFRLQAREIAGLKVGQIIQTTTPVDGLVELHINGRRRFLGTVGQQRRTLGLRITQAAMPAGAEETTRHARGRIS